MIRSEEAVRASGLARTIIRPSAFTSSAFHFFLLPAASVGTWAWDYDQRPGGARTALRLKQHTPMPCRAPARLALSGDNSPELQAAYRSSCNLYSRMPVIGVLEILRAV